MKALKKAAVFAAVMALAASLLAGCSGSGSDYNAHAAVATYGDTQIPAYEASYYIRTLQYTYEYIYGYENLWDAEIQEHVTMADMVNEMALKEVYQTYVLMDQAQQLGLELDEEQEAAVQAAVDSFMDTYPLPVYNAIGVEEDELYNVFEHNALAMLAYEYAIADVDTNVTQEEARRCAVSVISLYDSSTTYNAEDLKDDIMERLDAGIDMASAKDEFSSYSIVLSTYTVGAGDFESSFGPAAMELQEGEYTAVYSETIGAWYIIYCDSYMDEDATEAGYAEVISDREDALFEESYAGWKAAAPEFTVNASVLATIDYSHTMYMDVQLVENPDYDVDSGS